MSVIGDNAARWGAWLTSGMYDLGYSQPRRWGVVGVQEGGSADADCSSLVAHCWNQGGVRPLFPADDGTWTGALRELAAARGFAVMPYAAIGGDAANLMAGDALLSERASGGAGHVALHIGGDVLAEAWVDSHGSDGWDDPDEPVGDQTGQETRQIPYADHPYTAAGLWTHILRPPASPAAGPPRAEAAVGRRTGPLLGVDISNHQAGINIASLGADFIIVMATQGDWFTNSCFDEQVNAALALGGPVGVYHYVDGSGVEAEVAHFLDVAGAHLNERRVFWAVDWEAGQNDAWGDEGYLRAVVDAVRARTGRRGLLYASSSVYPWGVQAATGCVPWVAQYASGDPVGWDANPWSDGTWPTAGAIHQYTDAGRLPGYGGNLDLDVYHGAVEDLRALTGAADTSTNTTTASNRRSGMLLIETITPWGATAWALITPVSGAVALDPQQAQAYNAATGYCGRVPWDHYELLVREAWQRRNDFVRALGGEVRESVDTATRKFLDAIRAGRTGSDSDNRKEDK